MSVLSNLRGLASSPLLTSFPQSSLPTAPRNTHNGGHGGGDGFDPAGTTNQAPPPAGPPLEGPLAVFAYNAFRLKPEPRPEDFETPQEYAVAKFAYDRELRRLQEQAAPELLRQNLEAARETPTGRAIVDAAEEAGVEIVVLSDAEYQERYPGTAGVTVDDGTVYVPASSVDDRGDTNVLEHELLHAVLNGQLSPSLPQAEREAQTAARFEEIGLDPEHGEAIAHETAGWENEAAAEHVATAYAARQIERERQGLPPESPEETAAYVARSADRHLALHLQDARAAEPPMTDAELVEQYSKTPTGQRYPPQGDTVEEQAAYIESLLPQLARPEYVEGPNAGEVDTAPTDDLPLPIPGDKSPIPLPEWPA